MTERAMLRTAGDVAEDVRVLVVDTEDRARGLTVDALLARGCVCDIAVDADEAVQKAIATRPQAILLDAFMLSVSGPEILERLKADHRTALIPVICVAEDRGSDTVLELLAAGADDYVAKPFDPDELRARIAVATRRRALLGGVSPLTGLPGNLLLTRVVQARLDRRLPFAFLHVDLDNFKGFNDRYGYVRGDEVIAAMAVVLEVTIERLDAERTVLGHIGGDDFGIVTPSEYAAPIAEEVAVAFDRIVPGFYDPDDRAQGRVALETRRGERREVGLMSVSIGVAMWTSDHPRSAKAVADMAAEMKSVAKRQAGSYVAVDRRRA